MEIVSFLLSMAMRKFRSFLLIAGLGLLGGGGLFGAGGGSELLSGTSALGGVCGAFMLLAWWMLPAKIDADKLLEDAKEKAREKARARTAAATPTKPKHAQSNLVRVRKVPAKWRFESTKPSGPMPAGRLAQALRRA